MNEILRQTGRTTRLVEKAVQLAQGGRAVYVLVYNRNDIARVQRQVDDLWNHHAGKGRSHGIKVETPDDLGNWDWETLTLRRAHPNCEVLLDHFLVEKRIAVLQTRMRLIAEEIGRLYPLTV